VAVLWVRDGIDWHSAVGLSSQEGLARDGRHQKEGFHPVDAAGYHLAGEPAPRYCLLWARQGGPETTSRVLLGATFAEFTHRPALVALVSRRP